MGKTYIILPSPTIIRPEAAASYRAITPGRYPATSCHGAIAPGRCPDAARYELTARACRSTAGSYRAATSRP